MQARNTTEQVLFLFFNRGPTRKKQCPRFKGTILSACPGEQTEQHSQRLLEDFGHYLAHHGMGSLRKRKKHLSMSMLNVEMRLPVSGLGRGGKFFAS